MMRLLRYGAAGAAPTLGRMAGLALLGLVFGLLVLAPAQAAAPAQKSDAGQGALPDGIEVTTSVSTLQPTLRSPFLVTLTVIDRARSLISLKLHRPNGEAIEGRRISISLDQVTIDGRLANRRVYRWAVSALKPGEVALAFATMTLQVTDAPNKDWHWTPLTRTLTVQPLPSYLPEYLPVAAKLTLHQQPLPALAAGQLVDWVWTVRGRGLTERWLRTVLDQQLIDSARLHFGRPEIRTTEGPADEVAADPLAQTFEVRIPILPDPRLGDATTAEVSGQASGQTSAKLPALRLPYLQIGAQDGEGQQGSKPQPVSARLAYVTLPARQLHWRSPTSSHWRWSQLWRAALIALAGTALAWVLWRIGGDIYRRFDTRRRHGRAQGRLAEARTAMQLLAVLREVSGLDTPGAMGRAAPNPRFLAALEALDRACYGEGAEDVTALRAELARWLPRSFFD